MATSSEGPFLSTYQATQIPPSLFGVPSTQFTPQQLAALGPNPYQIPVRVLGPSGTTVVTQPSSNINPGAGQYSYTNYLTNTGGQDPGSGFVPSGVAGARCRDLARLGCSLLVDPIAKAACYVAAQLLPDCGPGAGQPLQASECPPGKRRDAQTGACIDITPGMTTPAEASGATTIGMGGMAARLAYNCGNIKGNPILCCPKGHVLGVDSLCYAKGLLPRAWRKWKPGRKPLVTAGDLRALSRFSSVQGRIKKAAGRAGLTATKKGAGRSRKHAAGCACVTCKR